MSNGQNGKNPGGTFKMLLGVFIVLLTLWFFDNAMSAIKDAKDCKDKGGKIYNSVCLYQNPSPSPSVR